MYSKAIVALAAFLATSSASPISRRQESGSSGDTSKNAEYSNKRGVCYKYTTDSIKAFEGSASWAYHWTSLPDGDLPSGIEFVPTLHPLEATNGVFKDNAQKAIDGGSKHLLFLNEPDKPSDETTGGTAIDPKTAADWYKGEAYQATFGGKDIKLGGPGVSAGDEGLVWLQKFHDNCADCQIDYIPLHFYAWSAGITDAETQFASFQGWLQGAVPKVQEIFKRADGTSPDIWLTEFGYVDIDANNQRVDPLPEDLVPQEAAYMEKALSWLDGNADDTSKAIKRYAYFMSEKDHLLDQSGALNTAGKLYTNSA